MKHNTARYCMLLLLVCSMGFLKSWGQEKRTLGLQEAIDLSVKNSSQLKYSTAKIEEATGALREAIERRLPEASVSGSYLRLNNPNIDLKLKTNSGGGSGTGTSESPKASQAAYALANVSLP